MLAAMVSAREVVSANSRTLPPEAAVLAVLAWCVFGTLVGVLAARVANRLPLRHANAPMAYLATGALYWHPIAAVVGAAFLAIARAARRRVLPGRTRLDFLLVLAVPLAVAATSPDPSRNLPPGTVTASAARPATTPHARAVPVTLAIHVHPTSPPPDAGHLPLRALAASGTGRRAALATGRVPSRTRVGAETPRRFLGGGLTSIPHRPGPRLLSLLLPAGTPGEGPFRPVGTLSDFCASAGIPVLTEPPSHDDPPLFLRLLPGGHFPSPGGGGTPAQGVRIDISLKTNGGGVFFSGSGIRADIAPAPCTLMDVTATALHLLGIALPRNLDGRVLVEVLEAASGLARPVRYDSRLPASSRDPVSLLTTSR
ncbi:MAG: hypothetical protein QF819_01485 [Gemmatimonadota bacterium]|jgi:hypothetical protein|nr:hypothetical protein [Gemmatimonadota bacterium]MDP6529648.1 hypothetical protein [Gemmatimonadota bacterium]MDP6801839.1 hypothetical protein [Gemmatimonadota bacterium]MDP7031565.1 hypothetical protein [Gemmatimonadota bacterium]